MSCGWQVPKDRPLAGELSLGRSTGETTPTLGLFAVLARAAARRIRWRQVWVDRYGRVCVQNVARGI